MLTSLALDKKSVSEIINFNKLTSASQGEEDQVQGPLVHHEHEGGGEHDRVVCDGDYQMT